MAINWMPPVFLPRNRRRPPKKTAATSVGQRSAIIRFTKSVRAPRNSVSASWHISISRICWGRKPSGPPADRAAVGSGFQVPYPSHTHRKTCGNSHTYTQHLASFHWMHVFRCFLWHCILYVGYTGFFVVNCCQWAHTCQHLSLAFFFVVYWGRQAYS